MKYSNFVLLFQGCFGYSANFLFLYEFLRCFSISAKKKKKGSWDFDVVCIEFINQFGENHNFNNEFSKPGIRTVSSFIYIFFFLLIMFCVFFLEKWEGEEREKARNINMREEHWLVAFQMYPDWDQTHNLGMCPDWESNLWPIGSQDDAQPSHTSQGVFCKFQRTSLALLLLNLPLGILFFYDAIVREIAFWHSFSDCILLVYTNITDFCILILDPATLKSFISLSSSCVCVHSLWFSITKIYGMWIYTVLLLPFPSECLLFLFLSDCLSKASAQGWLEAARADSPCFACLRGKHPALYH